MDAALDEAAIRARWSRTPAANVAVPTGRRSGLLVLDVDADAGGFEALAALEKEGSLPKTSRARTGGGGMHVYFKYPRSHPWDVKNSASLLGRGLDVRGEGGYVLVPPSVTQGPYRWTDRAPLAHAHWLLDRLRDLEGPTLF
jgi:putative DNA primase/helicase